MAWTAIRKSFSIQPFMYDLAECLVEAGVITPDQGDLFIETAHRRADRERRAVGRPASSGRRFGRSSR